MHNDLKALNDALVIAIVSAVVITILVVIIHCVSFII